MERPNQITETASESGRPVFIVVMGVAGTGKSTLGSALARALGMPYVEGDDLHPQENVDKMAAGTPLDDVDREPWLELIRTTAERWEHAIVENEAGTSGGVSRGVVATCSALKKYYRDILRGKLKPAEDDTHIPAHLVPVHPDALPTYFVFIDGKKEVLMDRMTKRTGHFMKASMLDGQLSTLESPVGEKGVVEVSIEDSTEDQVRMATEGMAKLGLVCPDRDEEGKQ